MKTTANDPTFACRHPARRVGFAMLVGLTLASVIAHAAVIDDFNGASPGWPGANPPKAASDPPAVFELADQRLRMAASFTTATSPASPFDHFMNIYYWTNLPVDEGRTLELRADLVSASHDNLFAFLATMNASGGEYLVVKDRNEIGLLKWSQNDGFSLAFWTNRVIKNQGVVLKLTLTPISKGLVLGTKVLDKGTGAVLFEREALDTPASDWGVPDPLPHGWQIFNPDPGQPYAEDLTLVGAGMLYDTDGEQGLAEMRLDNLEYDTYSSAYLEIGGGAALLTWPEDTAEEQIVVGADSVPSTAWVPLPEPIYKRFGQFCMALPTTNAHQFWKLVAGTQFVEDFDPPKPPFLTKGEWTPYFYNPVDSGRFEVTNTGNAMRIRAVTAPADGRAIVLPPGPDVIVGDFFVSVDLREFVGAMKDEGIAIMARGWRDPGDPAQPFPVGSNGYIGGIAVSPPGKAFLFLYDGVTYDPGGSEFSVDAEANYRLEFSNKGNELSVRLVDLTTKQEPVEKRVKTATSFQQGWVALWVQAQSSSYSFTLDNFFVTGTKP